MIISKNVKPFHKNELTIKTDSENCLVKHQKYLTSASKCKQNFIPSENINYRDFKIKT